MAIIRTELLTDDICVRIRNIYQSGRVESVRSVVEFITSHYNVSEKCRKHWNRRMKNDHDLSKIVALVKIGKDLFSIHEGKRGWIVEYSNNPRFKPNKNSEIKTLRTIPISVLFATKSKTIFTKKKLTIKSR